MIILVERKTAAMAQRVQKKICHFFELSRPRFFQICSVRLIRRYVLSLTFRGTHFPTFPRFSDLAESNLT